MRKLVSILVFAITIVGMYSFSYASEIEKDIAVNAKTQYEITDVVEGVRVDEDEIEVELGDGTVIRATGEFEDTIRLMVMPITKSMTKEWNWLQSVTKKIGENKSAYDIFFINSLGKRVDGGEGSQISVMTNSKMKDLSVYYIESTGKETKLESTMEEYVVKFKMMKNGYYTLLTKSIPKKTSNSTSKSKKKTTSKKDNKKNNKDESDKVDEEENKDEEKDEEKEQEDTDSIEDNDNDDTSYEDLYDYSDNDGDDSEDKKPDGSSGNGNKGGNKKSVGDIITLLSIIFVFISTGIIFLIILKKKKKEKDDEEEIE